MHSTTVCLQTHSYEGKSFLEHKSKPPTATVELFTGQNASSALAETSAQSNNKTEDIDDHSLREQHTPSKRQLPDTQNHNTPNKKRQAKPSCSDASVSAVQANTMIVLHPSVLEHVPEIRCTSCDRPGHANNEDRQCAFYGRARDQMAWAPNHPDSGLGDTVPHISETRIRISANGVEQTEAHRQPFWY